MFHVYELNLSRFLKDKSSDEYFLQVLEQNWLFIFVWKGFIVWYRVYNFMTVLKWVM